MSKNRCISPNVLIHNALVGLTVSFVALSLGAAFGILSGRGASAGMISAGLIAFITSLLGGTRIQCSGPTAPMSTVTAVVVAAAYDRLPQNVPNVAADHFINVVILLTGLILIAMAVLRVGKYISLVPNVVISGFMNGIALLIWLGQFKKLFGLGGKSPFGGPIIINSAVAVFTFVIIIAWPPLARKINPNLGKFLPGTLLSIIVMTTIANMMGLPISHISLGTSITGISDVVRLIQSQWPSSWSMQLIVYALPFAFELAFLCYLDTLLTSLVIDKMSGETTKRDQELVAQGVANGTVALVGGIPGAQATIRSVLMIKEGASLRIAGILVGLFALIEMILLPGLIEMIPDAVFAGILFKVGYDVFDFLPVRLYLKELLSGKVLILEKFLDSHEDERIFVTDREMLMIIGTTLVTIFFNLNLAVGLFTVLFYFMNKIVTPEHPMRDLKPVVESSVFTEED